jgi:cytochrome b subunit of formate dehydrogenase
MVIVSFFGLAITGMTLKFSYTKWAVVLSHILGGFESAGYIHRVGAVITFTYVALHLWDVWRRKRREKRTWRETLFGANTILFTKRDFWEFIGSIKWFLGLGPRPNYGRWTYWEKFDYLAVFWGVTVIGISGLMLWFPEFFTRFLPGWFINVATIIHSDEALLAVGFIFTIHFFNTHLRPEKFPTDLVIFTGRVSLDELKRDKPEEYEQLMQSGKIKKYLAEPLPPIVIRIIKIFASIALFTGLSMVLLIIYAMIFAYR